MRYARAPRHRRTVYWIPAEAPRKDQLREHREEWVTSAREVIARLQEILGDDAPGIEHVGSTSIPSICVKPIVDIAVGAVSPETVRAHDAALEQAGFIFRGEDRPGQLLYVPGAEDWRTHHIHVMVYGDTPRNNYRNFRDYMNMHPDAARAYDELKRGLAARYAGERKAYTAGKGAFIEGILREAAAWRAEQKTDH